MSRELYGIYCADQDDRVRPHSSKVDSEYWMGVMLKDRARRERVAQMVSKGELQSAEDYFYAGMVFQHGECPDDFLMAHILSTVSGFKG